MKKSCQNCKADFEIDSEDLRFYERIAVPPPTFCPPCRLARKLIWRNERSLYKRKCDLCKSDVISMYKAEAPFPVYCHDCWWSDKWNPLDHGQEYDFSKPFFEQFAELQNKVPRAASYTTKNLNSDYVNYTTHTKNSYLLFGSWFNENCGYGQTVMEGKECWDCLFVRKCELCFSSMDCQQCSNLLFSRNCQGCIDSAFLYDCRNCQNCLFSWNLRNKNYHVFNQPVSKEEFLRIKKEMLGSPEALEENWMNFKKAVREQAIHKYMAGEHNYNVSGEFISNSKNVHSSFFIDKGENEKYAVRGGVGQKDSMDVFGVHAGELAYECNNIDFSSQCFFGINGENNMGAQYFVDCDSLNNSFGCISVRKKEYCILNKQYSKEEFEALKEKMVAHMNDMPFVDKQGKIYKYGEFFPVEICPHAYNESIAQEWLPLSKEKALALGYEWDETEEKNYTPTKSWKELPGTIEETDESILKDIILCQAWDEDKNAAQNHKCTKAFRIIQDELIMYKKWGLPLPRKCPNTRNFEMLQLRNKPNFYHRACMCKKENHEHAGKCQNEFESSYAPDRKELVYCESCYNKEVY